MKAALHNCECVICAALILLQTPGFLFLDLGLVVLTGDERVQLAPLLLCRGQRPSVPAVPPHPGPDGHAGMACDSRLWPYRGLLASSRNNDICSYLSVQGINSIPAVRAKLLIGQISTGSKNGGHSAVRGLRRQAVVK